MPELAPLALATLAVFAGTLTRVLTGFGFSLVAVPLLSLAWAPARAVAVAVVFQALSALPVAWRDRRKVDRRLLAGVCVGALVGMAPGLLLLNGLSEPALRGVLAVTFLGCIFLSLDPRRWTGPATWPRVIGVGLCAGLTQGLAAAPGPPLMAGLLSMRGLDASRIRATATVIFCLLGAVSWAALGHGGALSVLSPLACALMGAGMLAGNRLGDMLFDRTSERGFRRLALGVMMASALVTLIPLLEKS